MKVNYYFLIIGWLTTTPLVAQLLNAADIADAEKQGSKQYKVLGTITMKTSGNSSKTTNSSLGGYGQETKTYDINSSKTLTFTGITFMDAINNDSPDLCKYNMQIGDGVSGWIDVSPSGNYQGMDKSTYDMSVSVPGLGSCSSHSWGTYKTYSGGIEQLGYLNFCFFNPNKWFCEVIWRYKDVKMETETQDERCEAGQVIRKHDNYTSDGNGEVTFAAGNDRNTSSINFDGKKFIINYSNTKVEKVGETDITYTVIATLEMSPLTNIEAFIEPIAGIADYKQWLPKGPDPEVSGSTGNATQFTVFLRDRRRPGQKIRTGIQQVKYSLAEVSHEPGYAMNFPSENPSKTADLQVDRDIEIPNPEIEKLELTLTKAQDPQFKAVIQSFDYGANGKLKAIVTLDDGTQLSAQDDETKQSFTPIPFRKNTESRIADQWKEDQKATDMSDIDDKDDDDLLTGNKYKGDGFSLYEEYRGFIENKKHIRTDAHKKDLMICDKVKETESEKWAGRSQMGIDMLQSITGFITHSKFKEEEFGKKTDTNVYSSPKLDTLGLPSFKHDKQLNFNYEKKETHANDQYGLLMLPSPKELGYAAAFPKVGGDLRPVGSWYCLVITKDFDPTEKGYSSTMGNISKNGTISTNSQGKAKITTDEYAVTVAHELLHCCSVKHHGDKINEGIKNSMRIFSGKSVARQGLAADSTQVYALFETENYAIYHPISLFWEDEASTPITASDTVFKNGNKLLYKTYGVQQGNHSGVEDCVMRYDVADVYITADNKYYLIKRNKGTYTELTGITLCNSATGTGVNASGFRPRPRYGNADTGRGNCKGQVCINDKYKP